MANGFAQPTFGRQPNFSEPPPPLPPQAVAFRAYSHQMHPQTKHVVLKNDIPVTNTRTVMNGEIDGEHRSSRNTSAASPRNTPKTKGTGSNSLTLGHNPSSAYGHFNMKFGNSSKA